MTAREIRKKISQLNGQLLSDLIHNGKTNLKLIEEAKLLRIKLKEHDTSI